MPPQRPVARLLGAPLLLAVAYSAVGFSIYVALGAVAGRALGLTPLIFAAAGVLLVLAMASYAEGALMYPARGGASNLARHGFNELVSFIAGWALIVDFVLVVALAAISVPHYLAAAWDWFGGGVGEVVTAIAVIAAVAGLNVVGATGVRRQGLLLALAGVDVLLQLALIAVGAAVVFDPALLTDHLSFPDAPSAGNAAYALVIAMVAFVGIEAAANLAPDVRITGPEAKRALRFGLILPLMCAALAAVALSAVPVATSPDGTATTALGGEFEEAPLIGVARGFEPGWLATVFEIAVAVVAPCVLVVAATTAMLALSRHVYTLATNRQIPSWLGKLHRRHATPYVAICGAAAIAVALAIPGDVEMLAGVYAFGATLAITVAHCAVLRLRAKRPDAPRPYRMPFNVEVRGASVPLAALAGALLTGLAWLSVVVLHEEARWVGGGWMVFGVLGYVIYRRVVQGVSLTQRVEVPAEALVKEFDDGEYQSILVPVFGTKLDDDIVSTAGRLAEAEIDPDSPPARVELIYVMELPLTVPLDSPPSEERAAAANAALARAYDVASEYEGVEVSARVVRARDAAAGIVQAARESNAEAIVMGGEPPSKIRGGALLGARAGARPPEIGPVTEGVLRKAPCEVLITAPAAETEPGREAAVAGERRASPQ
ncbi:MAG TPA: universal stress protein [Solirubrobacterales bacterium]